MSEVRLVVCEVAGGLDGSTGVSTTRRLAGQPGLQWSGIVHGGTADRVIAGLASDPETLEELEIAAARFERPRRGERLELGMTLGLVNRPHDAGLVVIDLGARLVVINSGYSDPQPQGEVRYHNGQFLTGIRLPYHLDSDWLFVSQVENWTELAQTRRRERATRPRYDLRALLYGTGLLRFLVTEVWHHGLAGGRAMLADASGFPAFAGTELLEEELPGSHVPGGQLPDDQLPDDQTAAHRVVAHRELAHRALADGLANNGPANDGPGGEHVSGGSRACADQRSQRPGNEDLVRNRASGDEQEGESCGSACEEMFTRVHAQWLLTPNAEIDNQVPRSLLIRGRRHVGQDIQDRCDAWSLLQRSPPAVPRSATAWRSGPPGDHELILHYDLVRCLLRATWQARQTWSEQTDLPLTDAVLDAEVARLESLRATWLETPQADLGDRVPRHIIERERSRLPIELTGKELVHDPNCPCCQMLSELPGPSFWFLDAAHFDDQFAFSLMHETRRDYERAQRHFLGDDDEIGLADDLDDGWENDLEADLKTDLKTVLETGLETADDTGLDRGLDHSPGSSDRRRQADEPGLGGVVSGGRRSTGPRESFLAGWRPEGEAGSGAGPDVGDLRAEAGLQLADAVATVAVAEPDLCTWDERFDQLADPENDDDHDLPVATRIFTMSCNVMNLMTRLKYEYPPEAVPPEVLERITRLQHHYGTLREAVARVPLTDRRQELLDPIADRLKQVLGELAGLNPNCGVYCCRIERAVNELIEKLVERWKVPRPR